MASITVTNLGSTRIALPDLYQELAAGASVTAVRNTSDLPRMQDLISKVSAGTVSLTVTPSAAELASGMLAPPNSVQAADMAAVTSATIASGMVMFRISIPGAVANVAAYTTATLPFKFRLLDAHAIVSTAGAGGSTFTIRTASGGGVTLAVVSSAATGVQRVSTLTASATATPGTHGLYVTSSDTAAIAEIVITARIES